MKKILKKIITVSLLGGLILSSGYGFSTKVKPMNEIDPGPANSAVK